MPIDVPKTSIDHLDSAPLKVAVAQVRYSPVHAVEKRELVADFESRLHDRYVAQDAQSSQTLTIQIGAGSPPGGVSPPAVVDTVWPFRDDSRGYSVSLGNSSLAVEADSAYHDFPQFLGEFSSAVSACAEIFQPKRQMRLGLRYINEIQDERLGEDVRTIVNPELVAPVGFAVTGGLLRSLAELRVAESLGTFVVRHGLVDNTTYLLDFDYFSESQREFDPQRVIETVEQFHDLIEPFFIWSLSDRYLAELKRKDSNAS
jgi:uncharacterized protein (TIGR04255 family)